MRSETFRTYEFERIADQIGTAPKFVRKFCEEKQFNRSQIGYVLNTVFGNFEHFYKIDRDSFLKSYTRKTDFSNPDSKIYDPYSGDFIEWDSRTHPFDHCYVNANETLLFQCPRDVLYYEMELRGLKTMLHVFSTTYLKIATTGLDDVEFKLSFDILENFDVKPLTEQSRADPSLRNWISKNLDEKFNRYDHIIKNMKKTP